MPKLGAMNFVLDGVLDGGVNRSLYVDRHGKTLASLLLDSLVPAPVPDTDNGHAWKPRLLSVIERCEVQRTDRRRVFYFARDCNTIKQLLSRD